MNASPSRIVTAILLCAGWMMAIASPVQATNFSVLLDGGAGGGDTKPLVVQNPSYEEGSGEGVNPLYEPSAIILTPPQLSLGREVRLTLSFGDSISRDYSPAPGGGFVFEMTLEDVLTGDPITQFAEPFDIIFEVPRLAPILQQDALFIDTLALGYLDETKNPAEWVAEDSQLSAGTGTGGPYIRCECTHLTIFSFGPTAVPEPSTALLSLLACSFATLRRGHRQVILQGRK